MSKKVVTTLYHNQRKGRNTGTLTEALVKSSEESDCTVHSVRLQWEKLNNSLDGHNCWAWDTPYVREEDMGEIYEEIVDTDVSAS